MYYINHINRDSRITDENCDLLGKCMKALVCIEYLKAFLLCDSAKKDFSLSELISHVLCTLRYITHTIYKIIKY